MIATIRAAHLRGILDRERSLGLVPPDRIAMRRPADPAS